MPRLAPALALISSCTSSSGSARATTGSSSITTSSGTGSPSRRGSAPGVSPAAQRLRPLPGAAELDDVGAQVGGLDDAGQGAALAQRGDITDGGELGKHT